MASLALITKPITMPPLEHFRIGNKEQPDSATTLIIQLFELSVKTAICPIAPVVDKMSTQAPMETMTKSCDHQAEQSNPLSLGVDIFLTCNDILTAWPHSVGK
jgi:alpha-D-ribose 1-methylphosphonate 5-triphosphate synthase subunit PhnH